MVGLFKDLFSSFNVIEIRDCKTYLEIWKKKKIQDYLILIQVSGSTPSPPQKKITSYHYIVTLLGIQFFFFPRRARREIFHIADNSVRCLSNYFLTSCPLFRWHERAKVPIRRNFSHPCLPSFRTPGAETNYDFVKLETPWRESRERRSPRERSLSDTHSVFTGWFVFLPATFLPR